MRNLIIGYKLNSDSNLPKIFPFVQPKFMNNIRNLLNANDPAALSMYNKAIVKYAESLISLLAQEKTASKASVIQVNSLNDIRDIIIKSNLNSLLV